MKNKKPMMVIAIGVGKKRDGDEMEDMEDMDSEYMMEERDEMLGGGMTRYRAGGMTKSKGRDGCAIRGKTKGRMV